MSPRKWRSEFQKKSHKGKDYVIQNQLMDSEHDMFTPGRHIEVVFLTYHKLKPH
jgi:hypothetical protein